MRLRRASSLLLAGIITAARCLACTIVYPTFETGPDFRVKVHRHGRPANGVRVDLGRDYHATTDADGIALFRSVAPGSYALNVDHDPGVPDVAGVKVSRSGPANITVPLSWPSNEPLQVRFLRGTLRGPDFQPGLPQAKLSLELLEGISGKVLKSAQTSDHGEFDFEGIGPGLYFLSLKPSGIRGWSGEQINGLIVVSVDSAAAADHLDVDLGWTSCGLAYADRSKCPETDLHVGKLRGQVLDPAGAVLSRAEISLSGGSQTPVRMLTDRDGRFESPLASSGSYELFVKMPGFEPLRTTLIIDPSDERAQQAALKVQLGLLFAGSCSYAKVE